MNPRHGQLRAYEALSGAPRWRRDFALPCTAAAAGDGEAVALALGPRRGARRGAGWGWGGGLGVGGGVQGVFNLEAIKLSRLLKSWPKPRE